ncbi:Late embryogenesis abundant protein, group 1 protein [Thalictrum thalictroides]|uniref:Late embryogenesis abundant protein, group 1 protein n=1 Tax=Thalictrum thalictroides TaxID=46969 RepID=A0A7J6WH18_THATH|nr:Late embryogenesis abundant protein, group 1 protein [Thalictrum thalictroides]
MHTVKEKIKNKASAAKEKATVAKAHVAEKAEKATARSKGERQLAEEHRKIKEAGAKMDLHEEKAQHKVEKLNAKHNPLHHTTGTHNPLTGTHGHHTTTTGVHNPLTTGTHGHHGHGHHI